MPETDVTDVIDATDATDATDVTATPGAAEHHVGIISDTHGLVRRAALDALAGVELILHAGDVGGRPVLDALAGIAPVVAVRGNNDRDAWGAQLPVREVTRIGIVSVLMLHDLKEIDLSPAAAGHRVVISGHSHKPSIEERGGVLYVNPGSAGPRRFRLPVTVARLSVGGAAVGARVIELPV